MELPRNCRIVRQEPRKEKPAFGGIDSNGFHGGHGLATMAERAKSFPDDEWLVLEYPKGTDPFAVVGVMKASKHLWDVVLWKRPKVLLIRKGPLEYKDLWVDGAKPIVAVLDDLQDLGKLLIAGFWSMLGPKRVANMRLEGMEQADRKEGLIWGSWSSFVYQ